MTWTATEAEPGVVHVIPNDDQIQHAEAGCVCGPTDELVPNDRGPDGWLVIHHSLDGRERFE